MKNKNEKPQKKSDTKTLKNNSFFAFTEELIVLLTMFAVTIPKFRKYKEANITAVALVVMFIIFGIVLIAKKCMVQGMNTVIYSVFGLAVGKLMTNPVRILIAIIILFVAVINLDIILASIDNK